MSKLIVKAASITNLTDARFFAASGVNYIGFCFDPYAANYISPTQALAIKGWINGPEIVAEFANQDLDNVKNIIHFFKPDILEISIEMVDQMPVSTDTSIAAFFNLPIIIKLNELQVPFSNGTDALFYLISRNRMSAAINFNRPVMQEVSVEEKIALPENVSAIQIAGSVEKETGIRDYELIVNLLEHYQEIVASRV